jgi:hypothetical protein
VAVAEVVGKREEFMGSLTRRWWWVDVNILGHIFLNGLFLEVHRKCLHSLTTATTATTSTIYGSN